MGLTEQLMKEEGFLAADGCSHYYLINWSLGENLIGPNEIGTILV